MLQKFYLDLHKNINWKVLSSQYFEKHIFSLFSSILSADKNYQQIDEVKTKLKKIEIKI